MKLRMSDLRGNGEKLSQNIVFEQGSLGNLSKHLYNLRLKIDLVRGKPIGTMRGLISNFSVVGKPRLGAVDAPSKHVIASKQCSTIDDG